MAKGFPKGGGNMNNMMKQMQKLQKQMEDMQENLAQEEVEASVGGGVVKVVVNGQKELLRVEIDEAVVDPDDIETLQDLIIAAVNQGMKAADDKMEGQMKKLTGGLNIPGM